ncbi:Sterol regulatory element-binding protein cleavage-activating protein [Eumeta japonica]|uniref:Sterol regulatory element-binding protein cleavage-activating protein n=1 Tax=Eumeta variegata TaxID=151549 RepID=A0A4C1ZTJ8_EUMVA|nr:Sterol regulatory element-binding protein cleavage-activating protein [Eumeta japonica]
MEAVPLVVSGHNHEVECLVSDGEKIVSSCLQGTIKVWDSQNGDLLTEIDRYEYFNKQSQSEDYQPKEAMPTSKSEQELKFDLLPASCCAHNASEIKTKNEATHTLRRRLVDHVSNLSDKISSNETDQVLLQTGESAQYDFVKSFRDLYSVGQTKKRKNSEFENSKPTSSLDSEMNKQNHDKNKLSLNLDDVNFNEISITSLSSSTDSNIHNDQRTEFSRSSGSIESDTDATNRNWKGKPISGSPIWCMDFCSDLIVLGCADGRLEFWEASTAKLLCTWWNAADRNSCSGITHVRALAAARRFCMASLSGQLTLVRLNAYNAAAGVNVDWKFSTVYKRTHKRTGSTGSISSHHIHHDDSHSIYNRMDRQSFSYITQDQESYEEEVHCSRVAQCRAHQQPITEMHSQSSRILTGGQDHILKVFLNSDLTPLFTLHGHCGPITSCFIDHANPTIGGSGFQDGLLCVWDLYTGACLYSTQAHDGAVTSLAYTASYVISCGADERLCIWDRFQGHMLNSIHVVGFNYMSQMLPLTHTMLLIGDRSGLIVYDLSSGEIIRRVLLGQNDGCVFVRKIVPLRDAVVCDYANHLRIVRFPLVSKL